MVVLRRREIILGAAAALVSNSGSLLGCHSSSEARLLPPNARDGSLLNSAHGILTADGPVELWSWFDLPAEDPRSRELSGISWDPQERMLWGVQDETAAIVGLLPDNDLRSWRFGKTIPTHVGGPIDLEGLVVVPDGFIVSSEDGPRIIELDRSGGYRRDIPIPPHFSDARTNKSLESLTASPSGRYLFTTTEAALLRDGSVATMDAGTRVRIVRMEREHLKEVSEHVYVTDPSPYDQGDWGVADLAAISDDALLVLERGYSRGHGNTVRIYQTSLEPRASCLGMDQITTTTPALDKTLRVDLARLEATGLPTAKQPQSNPILDNYEGITLGPRLRDGRPTILMISDDNAHVDQFARILVLAVGTLGSVGSRSGT